MKTHPHLILRLLLLVFVSSSMMAHAQNQVKVEANLTVEASPEVYGLAKKWAEGFSKRNPGNEITVIREGQTGVSDEKLIGKITTGNSDENSWNIKLCRKLMVPVINSNLKNTVYKNGVTPEALTAMLKSNDPELEVEGEKIAVKMLLPEDKAEIKLLENYFDIDLAQHAHSTYQLSGKAIERVREEKNTLAFLPLKPIVNEQENELLEGLAFLPIDQNSNGQLDHMENIYSDVSSFTRGVWIGKYPKELCQTIVMTAPEKPGSAKAEAFISFLLTRGQDNLSSQGYSTLAYSERNAEIQHLKEPYLIPESAKPREASWGIIILVLAGIIIVTGLLANLIFGFTRSPLNENNAISAEHNEVFDEDAIEIPEGVYFDKSHTWTFMEKNGLLRMGIDDFLQKVTGPITKINLKKEGEKVMKGEPVATLIQNGKRINVKSPVSGTIHAFNAALSENASMINQSPFDEGWVYMIAPQNWRQEIPFLKLASEYHQWLKEEFTRLKDFLSYSVNVTKMKNSIVLQDGGAVKKHVLQDLTPQVWEEFQTRFLDSK